MYGVKSPAEICKYSTQKKFAAGFFGQALQLGFKSALQQHFLSVRIPK
jgi:hypothetical protein